MITFHIFSIDMKNKKYIVIIYKNDKKIKTIYFGDSRYKDFIEYNCCCDDLCYIINS
jgi:hypothetical protein